MVSAIILSAGASRRMGTPKALLKIGEKTFLRHIVDVLHSARVLDIVVVLGADADVIQPQLEWFRGTITINRDWEKGQLSSIQTGLNSLPATDDLHGVMICPVDRPLVSQALLVDLLQAFWKSGKKIVVPTFNGRRGHPVIFSVELFDELKLAPPDVGARAVVRNHPEEVCDVPTMERGICLNIDTPEDYKQYVLEHIH